MNWEDIEENHIGAISCGIHPKGLTDSEYLIACKIYLLQGAYNNIEYVRWWLYAIDRETSSDNLRLITKSERAKIKRAITRRINELKANLVKVAGIGESVEKSILYPKVEDWMRAR